jgi:hypothetical protein
MMLQADIVYTATPRLIIGKSFHSFFRACSSQDAMGISAQGFIALFSPIITSRPYHLGFCFIDRSN